MPKNLARKERALLKVAKETSRRKIGALTSLGDKRTDINPDFLHDSMPSQILKRGKKYGSFTGAKVIMKEERFIHSRPGTRFRTTRIEKIPMPRSHILEIAHQYRIQYPHLSIKDSYRIALDHIQRIGFEPIADKPKK